MNNNLALLNESLPDPDFSNFMDDSNNANYSATSVPMTPPTPILHANNEPRIFKKSKWTPEEDDMLRKSVSTNGMSNWSLIAESVPGRSGKQCRERWINQLCPNLNKDNWTAQEDAILVQQQMLQGNAWSKIAQFLPGRSSNNVKNRWSWLTRHRATPAVSPKMIPFMMNKKQQINQLHQMMMNQIQQTAPAEMIFAELNGMNNVRCGSAGLTGLPPMPNRNAFSQPNEMLMINNNNMETMDIVDPIFSMGEETSGFDVYTNNDNNDCIQSPDTNNINDFLSFDSW